MPSDLYRITLFVPQLCPSFFPSVLTVPCKSPIIIVVKFTNYSNGQISQNINLYFVLLYGMCYCGHPERPGLAPGFFHVGFIKKTQWVFWVGFLKKNPLKKPGFFKKTRVF